MCLSHWSNSPHGTNHSRGAKGGEPHLPQPSLVLGQLLLRAATSGPWQAVGEEVEPRAAKSDDLPWRVSMAMGVPQWLVGFC